MSFKIPPAAGIRIAAALVCFAAACSPGGVKLSEKSYPDGFSLRQPAAWEGRVVEKAYILVAPPAGSPESGFLFVQPFFLKEPIAADAWFEQALSRLAAYFPRAGVEKKVRLRDRPDEWAFKIRFEKDASPYAGLALCSVLERSGVLYVVASKAESFEADRGILLAMLQSFRFGEPRAGAGKPAAPRVSYARFSDPAEQAFTLEVPEGWRSQGGTSRRASVDLVHALETVSPDGRILIRFNDPSIPAFALPSPTLNFSGFPEGSWYSPGYGVRNMVRRYVPGRAFITGYLRQNAGAGLERFEIVEEKDRPDVVDAFNRIYSGLQAYGVQFTQHAGEAAFRFERGGEPFVGYGLAVTQVVYMPSMNGGNWNVALLLLYTSPESEADFVQGVFSHMFQSIQWNPQWIASQQQLTRDVSRIVSQTGQEISNIISDAYWTRQGVLDETSRRFSNAILGTTDVADPETGRTWKVEAGHNYYWAKPGGDAVVGTETYTRPDIDFTPLKDLR